MSPLLTDSELIRAASVTQSPIVRMLASRLADRGTQSRSAQIMLDHIQRCIESGDLSKAVQLIDQTREALDFLKPPTH